MDHAGHLTAPHRRADHSPRIVATYLVVGTTWIVATDLLVSKGSLGFETVAGLAKGIGFVVVTALGLLYLLARNADRVADLTDAALADSAVEVMCAQVDIAVLQRQDLEGALQQLCEEYRTFYGASSVWIAVKDGHHARTAAQAGGLSLYHDTILNVWVHPSLSGAAPTSSCPEATCLLTCALQTDVADKDTAWGRLALEVEIERIIVAPICGQHANGFVSIALTDAAAPHHLLTTAAKVGQRLATAYAHAADQVLERRLVAAMDAAADGIYICDTDRTIVWANDALARLTERTTAELIGISAGALAAVPRAQYELLSGVWASGRTWHGPYVGLTNGGRSAFTTQQTIAAITDARGEVIEAVVAVELPIQQSNPGPE